jgi:hypothetical protein
MQEKVYLVVATVLAFAIVLCTVAMAKKPNSADAACVVFHVQPDMR